MVLADMSGGREREEGVEGKGQRSQESNEIWFADQGAVSTEEAERKLSQDKKLGAEILSTELW